MAKCKYYNPNMEVLKKLCETLYKLPGCGAGGNLHILLDDDNFDDESILFCIKECSLHPEHPSSTIGAIICLEYLKMSMEERLVFDWYWNGWDAECPIEGKCRHCGYIDEDY